ncbi:MAG: hypothetical protein N3D82_03410 [Ignisphaera sp.]|nr:hypothetical protein [Ignisphaera sp.]MCX8168057.1 hypothetical protein [Ignisphaera sp.]MDW8085754.1 hypothetical protein [Ignisphaera sp.]
MALRLLGSTYTITRSNLVIVKMEDPGRIPKIGDQVFDANNELVGKVVDIIGPVTSPFAVLRPVKLSTLSLLKPSAPLFYRSRKLREAKAGR